MKIFKFLFMIFLSFIVINVNALEDCTSSEMKRLTELANNVKIDYSYTIEESDYQDVLLIYDIKIHNLNDDLKIYYQVENNSDKILIDNNQPTLEGYGEGETLTFSIYAYTTNRCVNKRLRTITVKLPIYNDYYYINKDKCSEYPDFKYCKEFMDNKELTIEEIDIKFEEYINDLKKDEIKNHFKINYIYYGLGIIVLIVLVIVIIVLKRQKNKKKDDL